MFAILQLNAKFMERQDCLKRLSANPKERGNNEQHLKATLPGKVGGDVVNVTAASDGQGTADPSVLGAPVSLGPIEVAGRWGVVQPASRFCEDGNKSSFSTTLF